MRVTGIDADDVLTVRTSDLEMQLEWSRLSVQNRKTLAVSVCRSGTPADHALAAFYLLAAGDRAAAEAHLRKAGDRAEALSVLFR
jgi:hypothetical protein